jgi:zona occludens toxin (predicted ATPase)
MLRRAFAKLLPMLGVSRWTQGYCVASTPVDCVIVQILDFPLQKDQLITVYKNTGPGYSTTLSGTAKVKLVSGEEVYASTVLWFTDMTIRVKEEGKKI